MRSPTPVNSNAGKKPRKPSTVWGGLLQPHAHSVALLDKAAKQWLHQLRATKSDKVSKCFRTVVSRQINPLFVVIQVAALQHKGRQWSYAQLALDLLELHDKEAVKEELKPFAAKNDNYGDSDQQAAQILDVLYAECTEVFAVWLEELHDKLPASSLLVCAGRSASATNSTEYFADGLKTEEQRDVQARRLMVALGRNLHDCNKLLPPHEWLSVVAKGSFAGSPFVRGDAVKVGTDRLVQDMLATLSSSSFMQEMLADSCLNFPEQAAYFNNLPQQLRTDAAIPPECWRLAAIAMKRDVWILEARLWRLSCYSCHDGSVCVYGNSAGTHSQLSKHWTEPGYHLRLGQLPLPEVLGENGYTYVFLLMESSGQIVSSSMMSATQLASAQSRTFAVKSLGYDLAAMDVNSKGPDGRPMSAQATKKSKDYPSLKELYMEWTDGILLNRTTGLRQWPLKVLEHRKKAEKKQHKVQWRAGGSKVRGEVNERLTIIYPILRQVYETHSSEGSYPVTDPVVKAAIEVVEAKRKQNGTTLTLKKLARFLSDEQDAICNSEFELMHFGWPLPANMLKGNPKRKRTNLDD